jgi:CO/xanthine dehydrogenase FAD-binding subunit
VSVTRDGDTCGDVRVAFNGIANAAFRDSGVEDALRGQTISAEAIARAAAKAADGADLMEDAFAGEAYRRQLAKVFARRALEAAAGL